MRKNSWDTVNELYDAGYRPSEKDIDQTIMALTDYGEDAIGDELEQMRNEARWHIEKGLIQPNQLPDNLI